MALSLKINIVKNSAIKTIQVLIIEFNEVRLNWILGESTSNGK